MENAKRSQLEEAAVSWVRQSGTDSLDPLQGVRWNRLRQADSGLHSLPAWVPRGDSVPHLSPITLADLAYERVTSEEEAACGALLDQHLAECADCLEGLDELCDQIVEGDPCGPDLEPATQLALAASLPTVVQLEALQQGYELYLSMRCRGPRFEGILSCAIQSAADGISVKLVPLIANDWGPSWDRLELDFVTRTGGCDRAVLTPGQLHGVIGLPPADLADCLVTATLLGHVAPEAWSGLVAPATRPSEMSVLVRDEIPPWCGNVVAWSCQFVDQTSRVAASTDSVELAAHLDSGGRILFSSPNWRTGAGKLSGKFRNPGSLTVVLRNSTSDEVIRIAQSGHELSSSVELPSDSTLPIWFEPPERIQRASWQLIVLQPEE